MQIESVLDEDLNKIVSSLDKNKDGYIQYTEFISAAKEFSIAISDLYLKHAFDLFNFQEEFDSEYASIPIEMLQSVLIGAINFKTKITA